jgi:hypothetical protein
MRRLLPLLALLLIGAAPPPAISLPVDAPILASINGQTVALSVATGGVDRITLNPETVARLGIKPGGLFGKADVKIGRSRVLSGRNATGKIALAGVRFNQRMFWFAGAAPLPQQGSIGPQALPHGVVTVQLQPGAGPTFALPLYGNKNSGSYGVVRGRGYGFGLSLDVRGRTRLPLASAAVGADLAAALGGRLVGEPWQEAIFLGIRRPVRRLELDSPLVIGPFRFTEISVRVTDRRDGTAQLADGQQAISDADDDPAEIVVRADSGKQRQAIYVLTLSRTQLEAQGCTSVAYDKAGGQLRLAC